MLDNRLMAIARLAKGAKSLIDIGTDHGYLPIYLIKNNWIEKAIAADVSKGSLSKAIEEIEKEKLEDKIEARLGSGLEVLKEDDDVDIAVFAGMGGLLISQLIDKRKNYVAKHNLKLIMQPVQLPEILRGYLYKHNFSINHEELRKAEGRIYHILVAEYNIKPIPKKIYKTKVEEDLKLELGELNLLTQNIEQKKLLKELVEFKIAEIKKVNKHLVTKDTQNSKERLIYLKEKESELKKILNSLEV